MPTLVEQMIARRLQEQPPQPQQQRMPPGYSPGQNKTMGDLLREALQQGRETAPPLMTRPVEAPTFEEMNRGFEEKLTEEQRRHSEEVKAAAEDLVDWWTGESEQGQYGDLPGVPVYSDLLKDSKGSREKLNKLANRIIGYFGSMDEKSRENIILSTEPNVKIEDDNKGNRVVFKLDENGQYQPQYYMNPPGVDLGDFRDIGQEALVGFLSAGIAAGAFTLAGGPLLGLLAATGAAGGAEFAFSVIRDFMADKSGGGQGVDWEKAQILGVVAAGSEAGGRFLAPSIKKMRAAMKGGKPSTQAIKQGAIDAGIDPGAFTGRAEEALEDMARKAGVIGDEAFTERAAVKSARARLAAGAVVAAQKTDLPTTSLLKAQVDPSMGPLQDLAWARKMSTDAAAEINGKLATQAKNFYSDLVVLPTRRMGPGVAPTARAEDVLQGIFSDLSEQAHRMEARARHFYDHNKGLQQAFLEPTDLLVKAYKAMTDEEMAFSRYTPQAKAILGDMQKLLTANGKPVKSVGFPNIAQLRRDINSAYQLAQTGQDRTMLTRAKHALDDWMEKKIARQQLTGDEKVVAGFKRANKYWREYKELYGGGKAADAEIRAANKIFEDIGQSSQFSFWEPTDAATTYDYKKTVDIGTIVDRFFGKATGKAAIQKEGVKGFAKLLKMKWPNRPELHNQLGQAIYLKLIEPGMDYGSQSVSSAQRIYSELKGAFNRGQTEDLLRNVLPQEMTRSLQRIQGIAHKIGRTTSMDNFSNTAVWMEKSQNMLAKVLADKASTGARYLARRAGGEDVKGLVSLFPQSARGTSLIDDLLPGEVWRNPAVIMGHMGATPQMQPGILEAAKLAGQTAPMAPEVLQYLLNYGGRSQ